MKKIFLVFLMALIVGVCGQALAISYLSFDDIHMTSGNGTYDVRDTFGWDETPWVYFKYDGDIKSLYFQVDSPNPSSPLYRWADLFVNNDELWVSMDDLYVINGYHINSVDWNDIKTVGEWDLAAWFTTDGRCFPKAGFGSTSFTITPEPISSLLFLIGGGVLSALGIRRKRV